MLLCYSLSHSLLPAVVLWSYWYQEFITVGEQPLLAFDQATPGSKPFNLRLLELLAVSCHQIAVFVYQFSDSGNRHCAEHTSWRDEEREIHAWDWYRPPIAFTHGIYTAVEQYPNGYADVVGYWAEARIFGGILVFDRGVSGSEVRYIYSAKCHQQHSSGPLRSCTTGLY